MCVCANKCEAFQFVLQKSCDIVIKGLNPHWQICFETFASIGLSVSVNIYAYTICFLWVLVEIFGGWPAVRQRNEDASYCWNCLRFDRNWICISYQFFMRLCASWYFMLFIQWPSMMFLRFSTNYDKRNELDCSQ